MNPITVSDLMPFCSEDESRDSIRNPFEQEGYTYATDGRIIIRVHQVLPDLPERLSQPPKNIRVHFTFPDPAATVVPVDWTSLCQEPEPLTCSVCKGIGRDQCRHCDNEIECQKCDGSGKVLSAVVPVKIGEKFFDPMYLRKISRLPNIRLLNWESPGFETGKGPSGFIFDGGDGILMPMRSEQ